MKILPSWILMGKYSDSGGAQYLQNKTRAMDMINLQLSDDRTVSCQLCVVKGRGNLVPGHQKGRDQHEPKCFTYHEPQHKDLTEFVCLSGNNSHFSPHS
jgi:hypothetical protein